MKGVGRILATVVVILAMAAVAYLAYETFREKSPYELQAQIVHIEDTRVLSDELVAYLEHPLPAVRERAVIAVGRIGGDGTGRLAFELLRDSSLDVAAAAAFALGLTNHSEYASEVLDYAFDLPARIGAAAVEAAGRLADSGMTDITSGLTHYLTHPSPDVRAATCRALFYAGAKDQAAAMIDLLQEEPDDEVRREALYALARMKIAEAADVFVEFMGDPDPFVRAWALRGLARTNSPQAEHYLSIALNDADRQVVAQAIVELGRLDSPQATRLLVRRLEFEKDEKHLVTLLKAVRRQNTDVALARATELVESYPSVNVVGAGVTYLAAIRRDRAVNLIDSLIFDAAARMKVACAEAYGLVDRQNVVPRLATLFSDEDPMVRAAAFRELVELDSGNVSFYVDKAITDEDPVLKSLAVGQIEEHKLADYRHVLATMMSRGGAIDVDVRRALLEAAEAFLADDADDSLAPAIVVDGLMDDSYVIRREAAGLYEKTTGEDRSEMVAPARARISESDIERVLETYDRTESYPRARVVTERGEFVLELFVNTAPLTAINFMELARDGYYDGLIFHRVIPNFVVQGGDPRGDGWGGPDYHIRDEFSARSYKRGTVGIATSGKDTGGSQFFITLSDQPHLEGRYTVFGRVLTGMEVVDELAWGDVIQTIVIEEG